mgnify:CR=1 FL=1
MGGNSSLLILIPPLFHQLLYLSEKDRPLEIEPLNRGDAAAVHKLLLLLRLDPFCHNLTLAQ